MESEHPEEVHRDQENGATRDVREDEEPLPLGQRLFDSPFILLALGLLIMVVFYTGWGLLEIVRMTPSPLP